MLKKRTVEQALVYGLMLNTMGSAEDASLVALASSEQALKDYFDSQLLDKGEKIGGWFYSFKEGNLRNYNAGGTQWIFSEWMNVEVIPTDVHRVDF